MTTHIRQTHSDDTRVQYRYMNFLMMLFVTIALACDISTFRMTQVFGSTLPVSGLLLPLAFALGDLIADVYGYSLSRKLIWNALLCQLIFSLLMTLIIELPGPEGNVLNQHYSETFHYIIRSSLTSCLSITISLLANAFLMSKTKLWLRGQHLWMRSLISSSISEFLFCLVACVSLYAGLKSAWEIWAIILGIWYFKVIAAMIAAPFVAVLAQFVKQREECDTFDYGVSYNPFRYQESASRQASSLD